MKCLRQLVIRLHCLLGHAFHCFSSLQFCRKQLNNIMDEKNKVLSQRQATTIENNTKDFCDTLSLFSLSATVLSQLPRTRISPRQVAFGVGLATLFQSAQFKDSIGDLGKFMRMRDIKDPMQNSKQDACNFCTLSYISLPITHYETIDQTIYTLY